MKIIVTGSLGNISQEYVVTIGSSNSQKQAFIENLGAMLAIGSISLKSLLLFTIGNNELQLSYEQ